MNKIDKLSNILERLNTEQITEELRQEALELVKDINPLELSMAEQKLIEKGMKPEDLRHLCDIHMEVLKDELDKLKMKIDEGHVLYTLIAEHDEILGFLTELDSLNLRIQDMDRYDKNSDEFKRLKELSLNILSAEKHHQREEDVLFLEMEKRDITGPTRIMKMEHDELRERKHLLKDLSHGVEYMEFGEFKSKLDEVSKYIVFNLRDHIYKENYILYPTALESIDQIDAWDEMRNRCDDIGYCSFTPNM
ncbi:DUF438 domain-containing protein [Clostridium sp. D2Q-11]|uniref:DUF438 domain-containing protein n=1 Tax=Anaeromonas frigoriresistens TaxID=2683708 RepID=A0A942UTI4_9FIRM|nr:DUF438 domain-containing protein [Anaeromonas frigoriresistens]MBS4538863.1 DUF438 domain-containing protein [Anaeromonas frigoriresistens]